MLTRFALLACGAAALLLAACGGSASGDADLAGEFPTEEFKLTERELVTRIEHVEEAIGGCMAAAGFEYVAVDAETVRDAMDGLGGVPGVSDEDFAAQYGYGVSTQFENPGFATVFGERNVQVFDDLAPGDRVAYARALLGDDSEATFVFTLEVEDFSRTGGCTRTAIKQFFSAEELSPSYVNPIDVRVQQDPRLLTAQGEWSACMREAGFDYESSEDTDTDIQNRLDAITEGADPETLTGSAREAFVELQGYERALAVADLGCFEEFVEEVEEEVESEVTGAPLR